MKKTLIALAALAATGASFAQVTISGTVASGYKDSTAADGTNARTSGFGVYKAEINFTAKEDIGGGQTLEAKFGLANVSRGATAPTGTLEPESVNFGPGDLTLTYTNTSFGRIQMGTERGSALMSGIPSAGAPVVDMDGKIYQLRSSNDFISYAAPIGPVVFIYKHGEGSNVKGLGAGMSGAAGAGVNQLGQRTNDLALYYKQDGLEVLGAYRSYDNRNANSMTTGDSLTKDSALVFQAGYDLGPAKVGFGYNNVTASASPVKLIDMMVGISAPIGPLTVGATYGREEVSGIDSVAGSYFEAAAVPASIRAVAGVSVRGALSAANGVGHAVSFGAKYDLSKRTALTVNYARWQRSGYAQFEAVGKDTVAATTQAAAKAAGTVLVGAVGQSLGQDASTPTGAGATFVALASGTNASVTGAVGAAGAASTAAIVKGASGYESGVPTAAQVTSGLAAVSATSYGQAVFANSTPAQQLAQTNANAAAQGVNQMGYKPDGSEFSIVLSYSF